LKNTTVDGEVTSIVSRVKLSVSPIPPMGWQQKRRNVMDTFGMIEFEEAHTKWLCDCKAFEMDYENKKRFAYVVCHDTPEGDIFSSVFFTANDAFKSAHLRSLAGWSYADPDRVLLVTDYRKWTSWEDEEYWNWECEYTIEKWVEGEQTEIVRVYCRVRD
jgi:hypothetical protein